jgi:hypothetical protein
MAVGYGANDAVPALSSLNQSIIPSKRPTALRYPYPPFVVKELADSVRAPSFPGLRDREFARQQIT